MRSLLRGRGLLAGLLLLLLLAAWAGSSVFHLWVAEQRWGKAGLVNYRYTLQIKCFCPLPLNEPLAVEVQNGATARIRIAASGEEVPLDWVGERGTIPGLFTIIQKHRERNAAKLNVSYDEALGYPTHISIDDSYWLADDEADYQITDLAEIPATHPKPSP